MKALTLLIFLFVANAFLGHFASASQVGRCTEYLNSLHQQSVLYVELIKLGLSRRMIDVESVERLINSNEPFNVPLSGSLAEVSALRSELATLATVVREASSWNWIKLELKNTVAANKENKIHIEIAQQESARVINPKFMPDLDAKFVNLHGEPTINGTVLFHGEWQKNFKIMDQNGHSIKLPRVPDVSEFGTDFLIGDVNANLWLYERDLDWFHLTTLSDKLGRKRIKVKFLDRSSRKVGSVGFALPSGGVGFSFVAQSSTVELYSIEENGPYDFKVSSTEFNFSGEVRIQMNPEFKYIGFPLIEARSSFGKEDNISKLYVIDPQIKKSWEIALDSKARDRFVHVVPIHNTQQRKLFAVTQRQKHNPGGAGTYRMKTAYYEIVGTELLKLAADFFSDHSSVKEYNYPMGIFLTGKHDLVQWQFSKIDLAIYKTSVGPEPVFKTRYRSKDMEPRMTYAGPIWTLDVDKLGWIRYAVGNVLHLFNVVTYDSFALPPADVGIRGLIPVTFDKELQGVILQSHFPEDKIRRVQFFDRATSTFERDGKLRVTVDGIGITTK